MGYLSRWFQNSGPVVKMLMLISVTSAAVVVHRTVYGPYMKRKRLRKNEEWANMVIEQEEMMEQSEGSHNNISY